MKVIPVDCFCLEKKRRGAFGGWGRGHVTPQIVLIVIEIEL